MFTILVICTGNICRSPAGELLLRSALPAGIAVGSAGTAAVVGSPVHPLTAAALGRRGVEADPHAGRQLVAEHVTGANLVLAMTREHRAATVRLYPPAVARAFTFAEFARLTAAAGRAVSRTGPAGLLDEVRAMRGLVRAPAAADDDVPDPIGGSPAVHESVVAAVAQQASAIAAAFSAAGSAPP